MRYDRVSTNAKDNALLELQQFNVNQVARVLNIPVSYLFDGSSITEQEQTIFITQTIAPIASILLSEMKRKFFFKSEYRKRDLEFNFESLIKSDRRYIEQNIQPIDVNLNAVKAGLITSE